MGDSIHSDTYPHLKKETKRDVCLLPVSLCFTYGGTIVVLDTTGTDDRKGKVRTVKATVVCIYAHLRP